MLQNCRSPDNDEKKKLGQRKKKYTVLLFEVEFPNYNKNTKHPTLCMF